MKPDFIFSAFAVKTFQTRRRRRAENSSDERSKITVFSSCFLLWLWLHCVLCYVFLLFIFSIISVFHRPLCQQPLSPWKLQPERRRGGGRAGLLVRVHRRLWGRKVRSDLAGPATRRRLGPGHPLRSWAGHTGDLHHNGYNSAPAANHSPSHHHTGTSHPAAMAAQVRAEAAGCAVGCRQGENVSTNPQLQKIYSFLLAPGKSHPNQPGSLWKNYCIQKSFYKLIMTLLLYSGGNLAHSYLQNCC